uniref:DNA-directed RNA polymerase n=1 Tax=Physcomitrium patens TaxID=3218 RepID=A0A2K1KXM1_PHYPA|nr:hypothetical protein PHYPA_005529 [Physcomitrium patens]
MNKQEMPLTFDIMTSMVSNSKILTYAQKPICITTILNIIKKYNGVNVVIVVLSYSRYNKENSLLFNKSLINRGLFSSIKYEVVEIVENKFMNETLVYIPDGDILYDNDGIILVSQQVKDYPMLPLKPKSRESNCIDATTFNRAHRSFEANITRFSKEKIYCGTTRLPIEARVATDICYYHTFRHQARDKVHSISKGQLRKIQLQFKEIEKDCLIVHRITLMLLEKLKNTFDLCEIWICHDCSTICSSSPCINCNERNMKEQQLSNSSKLLAQELSIANIRMGLKYT